MEEKQLVDEKKIARDEAYKDVKMYIANDWKLKEETPEMFVLTRNNGSTTVQLLLAFFIGWYTFFIPNIIYFFVKKETKKILK